MTNQYHKIYQHYEKCYQEHGDTCQGFDWPNQEDNNIRFGKMLEIIDFTCQDKINILDFGCGSGHFYQYLVEHHKDKLSRINYHGLEISQIFSERFKEKYPDLPIYRLDILKDNIEDLPKFDYIMLNGVFTEKRDLNDEEMETFFQQIIIKISTITKKGIVFNVMTPIVDFKNDTLFYYSFDKMGKFIKENFTRKFKFDQSYGLWDYMTFIYF